MMLSRVARVCGSIVPRLRNSSLQPTRFLPTTTTTPVQSRYISASSGEGEDGRTVDVEHSQQQTHTPPSSVPVRSTGRRRRRGRGTEARSDDQSMDELDLLRDDRDEDLLDTRHHFDAFRTMVNQLMHDFDDSIGGGFLTDRDRSRQSRRGLGRGREDRGLLSSLLPSLTPPSMLELPFGFGGRRGSLWGDQPQQRQIAPTQGGDTSLATTGGGMTDALSPLLSPMLDLMPPAKPIAIRLDIEDKKDRYAVTADVPGLKSNELKVNVDRGVLTIEGRHKEHRREEDPNRRFLRVERSLGTVRRSLRLPEDVDASKVSAKYDAGTLKIELPKKPQSEQQAGNVKIEEATAAAGGSGEQSSTESSKQANQNVSATE